MGDMGEEEEERLKKLFVAKQMYSSMLNHKLQSNEKKSSELQEGFQRIKEVTGLGDVNEIVHKFVHREETVRARRGRARPPDSSPLARSRLSHHVAARGTGARSAGDERTNRGGEGAERGA